MEAALRVALDRHGMSVEVTPSMQAVEAVMVRAPDLVLLIGDAASEGGAGLLRHLAENPVTSVVPVALLSNDNALDERMRAFRSGAVAVVAKSASADAVARKIVQLARELPEREGEAAGELGDTTLEDLMSWVTSELRSGILSVETKDASGKPMPMRLVLGSGGQVSEALSDFVRRLKPLVSKAEPVRYELLESTGGRLGLLEDDQAEPGSLDIFQGIRILLMDNDPGRADVLAQALREHGSTVALTDPSVPGLERARSLDPDVVLFDAAAIDGPGFEAVRELRRDPRLRWAGLLVVRWEELWPKTAASPDLPQLASRVAPLVQHERSLSERASSVEAFDTRLELTGPARLIRTLARIPGTRHAIIRNPKATVELDLADGLIVGAQGTRHGEAPLPMNGTVAIAALLALSAGRVRVERRGHPSVANVMTPVDEALHTASSERSVVAPTIPPSDGMLIPSEEMDDDEQSSPGRKPVQPEAMPSAKSLRGAALPKPGAATLAGVGSAPPAPSPSELSWGTPAPTKAPPAAPPKPKQTVLGVGSPSAMPPTRPMPPTKEPPPPKPQAKATAASAFGSVPTKPPVKTISGVGGAAAGAFASPGAGLRPPRQGATDETRPVQLSPEGLPVTKPPPQGPATKAPPRKGTMMGLGSLSEDEPFANVPLTPKTGAPPPKPSTTPQSAPSTPPVDVRGEVVDEEDLSEQTVVGDSLAHARLALQQQDQRVTVRGRFSEDVATADTMRPAPGAMLGMMPSSPGTVPVGVPVADEPRTGRSSVPAPGGTWSDRPGGARPSQPAPAAAAGAFGDAAKSPTPEAAFAAPPPPRVPTLAATPLMAPPTQVAVPAQAPAPKPTTSDETNTVGTGEHTLIIPRDKAMTPVPSSRRKYIVAAFGLAFVVGAAVLGVVASRTFFKRGPVAAHTTPPANPPATPPTAPTPPAPTPTAPVAVADAAVAAPVAPDAAVAVAPVVPDAAVAVAPPVPPPPAPTPTPTTTPTDLTGITPDARLPRDRAAASDVLVSDALALIEAGRLDVARVALDHALELDRINPQAYEAYARYDIAARNPAHAIEMAERAVDLRRQSRYYLVLGDAYLAAGNKAEARAAWERGVAIDRDRTCRARLEANP